MYAYYNFDQFYGVVDRASNIGQSTGNYTSAMFMADFPQFFLNGSECFAPETVLELFISQVNTAIQPDKWFESWRYACGLYVAHYLTLYLQSYTEDPMTASQAAATGSIAGVVKSATLGDSSVTYDTSAVTKATEEWGDLNATCYGQQLATRARLVGMGGMTVI